MLDGQAIQLMHRHAEGESYPMVESPHGPADHDIDRAWARSGARIFKCSACDEEIEVAPPGSGPDSKPEA